MGRPRILIVGAGIGGLTAAASLLRGGYRVKVFEQAEVLEEIGAGIQISANAVKVVRDLGLGDALEAIAVRPARYLFRRFDTGEVVQEIPLGARHLADHGAPYYHVHRADFHRLLVEKVRQLDPEAIELGRQVEGFSESDAGVVVRFADGGQAEGEVLIGADGIKSPVRRELLGDTPAHYTGDVAWRALVPSERLPADIMDPIVTVWCGPKRHVVMYYVRGGALLNFVATVEREMPVGESWTLKRPWSELKADFEGWHADVQTVIDAIDRDACYQWALNDRQPVARWSSDRATLLGDSAHATLPYMAQGAVMAIEDGAVLARCFGQAGSVPEALDLYQRNRIGRTSRIVLESAGMRGLYRIENEEEMRRAFAQKDLAKARGEWLYSYDPLTVPLT